MKRSIYRLLILSVLVFAATFCSKEKSTEPTNNPPQIQSVSANQQEVSLGEIISITCTASDADGDNISFSWSSSSGSFPNGNSGSSIQWQAPNVIGLYSIVVRVTDGSDDFDEGSISISVIENSQNDPCSGLVNVSYLGKTYNTVEIGSQCWLKENLDVGTMISSTSIDDNQTDNGTIEKYCYDNDPANCETFGGLYQWNEAMNYTAAADSQGICPDGWHIPSSNEFRTLLDEVNSHADELKAVGQGTGTNTSGFSALLAGFRAAASNGVFANKGSETYYWTSNQVNTQNAHYMRLFANEDYLVISNTNKNTGKSIRCIKD